jgi:hypothetical protein
VLPSQSECNHHAGNLVIVHRPVVLLEMLALEIEYQIEYNLSSKRK